MRPLSTVNSITWPRPPGCEPGPADAWLSADAPLPLLRVVYGKQPLAEALRAGEVTLAGDQAIAERFVALFSLPAKVA